MRTYRIRVDDQEYTIEIDDPNASPATVQVNGTPFTVSIVGQTATVEPMEPRRAEVEIEESYVPAVTTTFVETPPPDLAAESEKPRVEPSAPGEGAVEVVAPMPGKVMDIAVQVGERVQQGDTLCNLEAMKMKSPIRSTSNGTVVQVRVREGQNVNYGDVLFTLS